MTLALHVYGVLVVLFWGAVWIRTTRGQATLRWVLKPTASPETAGGPLPTLWVVIPARDEAANIAACVVAVRASDHPSLRVLVFDDGSTDGTAELALAAGAEVVRGTGELPAGWKGKPWALQRATRGLAADWLLFLDADVRVDPRALSRVHAWAIREGADFLSGFGRLVMESFWEKVVQPSVGGLILAGNDLGRVNDPQEPEHLVANGQLILVRRSAYEAVGGHEAVKADILDDVGLARAFYAAGYRVRVLFMRELFSCRMYTGLRALWLGWTKNLYAGLHHRPGTVAVLVGFIVVEMILPYLVLPVGLVLGDPAWIAWGLALPAVIHLVRAYLDGVFGQERAYGLLQPLGSILLVGILVDSMRRSRAGSVSWKGRTYAVRPEDDTLARVKRGPGPRQDEGTGGVSDRAGG